MIEGTLLSLLLESIDASSVDSVNSERVMRICPGIVTFSYLLYCTQLSNFEFDIASNFNFQISNVSSHQYDFSPFIVETFIIQNIRKLQVSLQCGARDVSMLAWSMTLLCDKY